ncbi:hypothetical protein SMAC4_13732 [Sordaria macrospora]|uniref:uncharacterized protein n=1 Tax=Sordaria macrospora TaxID=5147 RepID=UPI002B3003EA|nr:hypothetical protein SMAC4_13732 [Sordaria macrospora]
MSTPSPSGAPKPPPPAIIPVTPLPDIFCVPPPPSTTAQSAKRARTADEEVRPAHATTASPAASGPIKSLAETLISEALAKTNVYRSFAAFLDTELPRLSAVSPAHAREADSLARTITAALQKSSASPTLSTPDTTAPTGKGPVTFAEIASYVFSFVIQVSPCTGGSLIGRLDWKCWVAFTLWATRDLHWQ